MPNASNIPLPFGGDGAITMLLFANAGGRASSMATVVEILNVPRWSPPVPQTSRISPARVTASIGGWIERAKVILKNAAISSADSPFFAERGQKKPCFRQKWIPS